MNGVGIKYLCRRGGGRHKSVGCMIDFLASFEKSRDSLAI